jgi:hypothetical protein
MGTSFSSELVGKSWNQALCLPFLVLSYPAQQLTTLWEGGGWENHMILGTWAPRSHYCPVTTLTEL